MVIQPEHTALVFPGQGSQSVRMGCELAENFPSAREIFEQADDLLDFPLSRLAWFGPEDDLNDTINTQPALLTHSVAALRVFQEMVPEFTPAFVAGHSMGELSALVASGALPFADTLYLARRRGELMKMAGEKSPGGMAAILGLDIPTLESICTNASITGEVVQVANDNCPGQVVISGSKAALERAVELARLSGARHAKTLAVSIAAHSPLMASAQLDFSRAVEAAPFRDPDLPIVGNVSALPMTTVQEIRLDLQAQLSSRVRWTESVQTMLDHGVNTFIEVGSGTVLTGLLKRISRDSIGFSLGSPQDFSRFTSQS